MKTVDWLEEMETVAAAARTAARRGVVTEPQRLGWKEEVWVGVAEALVLELKEVQESCCHY